MHSFASGACEREECTVLELVLKIFDFVLLHCKPCIGRAESSFVLAGTLLFLWKMYVVPSVYPGPVASES